MGSVDEVVRSHEAHRLGIPLRHLERHQIDFAKGSLSDDAVTREPLVFQVVADVVLQCRRDARRLDAIDGCHRHLSRQNRILAERFEASAAQR